MDRDTFQTVVLPLLTEDSFRVIIWLKQRQMLKSEVKCDSCENEMNWTKYAKSKDGYAWKCHTKDCAKFKSTVSIRTGSFFSKSRLMLQTWVHVMYMWSERIGESKQVVKLVFLRRP